MRRIGLALTLVAALALPATAAAEQQEPNRDPDAKTCAEIRSQAGVSSYGTRYCLKDRRREAKRERSLARKQCRKQLAARQVGDSPRKALRVCVAKKLKRLAHGYVKQLVKAARACKRALVADPEGFAVEYGSNRRSAFVKCVRSQLAAEDESSGGKEDDETAEDEQLEDGEGEQSEGETEGEEGDLEDGGGGDPGFEEEEL